MPFGGVEVVSVIMALVGFKFWDSLTVLNI